MVIFLGLLSIGLAIACLGIAVYAVFVKGRRRKFLLLSFGLLVGASISGYAAGTIGITQRSTQLAEMSNSACRTDLVCWAGTVINTAGYLCTPFIEKQAQYGIKWTDKMSETRFESYAWLDEKHGHVRYYGDKAMIMNGKNGDWVIANYSCDYSVLNSAVLGVALREGPLP